MRPVVPALSIAKELVGGVMPGGSGFDCATLASRLVGGSAFLVWRKGGQGVRVGESAGPAAGVVTGPPPAGLWRGVVNSGEIVAARDPAEPPLAGGLGHWGAFRPASYLGVPVRQLAGRGAGPASGCLFVLGESPRDWSELDRSDLLNVAAIAARAGPARGRRRRSGARTIARRAGSPVDSGPSDGVDCCGSARPRAFVDSDGRFRSVIDSISEGIVIHDAEGQILGCNASAERLLGLSLEELRGIDSNDSRWRAVRADGRPFPGEDHPSVRTLRTGELQRDVIMGLPGRGAGHDLLWISINSRPIYGPGGTEIQGVVTSFSDVSEVRRASDAAATYARTVNEARREVERERDRAEQANLAKSTFLANMSHEIRTPMNGVIGMTDLLLQSRLNDSQREYARTIRQSAETLLSLISEILDLSRIEAGKFELDHVPFDPAAVAEDVVGLLAPQAQRKGLEIAYVAPCGSPPRVVGDPLRFRQVLMNLVDNAVKFTDQGEVCVELRHERRDDPGGVLLRVVVRDTGIGIDVSRQAAVFESFTQADGSTHRRHGGSGLGLTICRHLVGLMGGDLSVESCPGLGTLFRLSLTFTLAPPATNRQQSGPPLLGLRAMVAGPCAMNRGAVASLLIAWGCRVDESENARDALTRLQAAAAASPPDLYEILILDNAEGSKDPGADLLRVASVDATDPVSGVAILGLVPVAESPTAGAGDDRWHDAVLTRPVRGEVLYSAVASVVASRTRPGGLAAARNDRRRPVRGRAEIAVPRPNLGLTVLLVEDQDVNLTVAVRLLERIGCKVEIARNGAEALCRAESGHYDVILMDVQMPVMDGMEATAELRRRERERPDRPRATVLALTAHAMDDHRRLCLAAGMDGFITKPVTQNDLVGALRPFTGGVEPPPSPRPTGAAPKGDDDGPKAGGFSVDRLNEMSDGDDALRRSFCLAFLDGAAVAVHDVNRAIAEDDPRLLVVASHKLRGMCLNLGAELLAGLAADFERIGKSGAVAEARADLPQFSQAWDDLLAELEGRGLADRPD